MPDYACFVVAFRLVTCSWQTIACRVFLKRYAGHAHTAGSDSLLHGLIDCVILMVSGDFFDRLDLHYACILVLRLSLFIGYKVLYVIYQRHRIA